MTYKGKVLTVHFRSCVYQQNSKKKHYSNVYCKTKHTQTYRERTLGNSAVVKSL